MKIYASMGESSLWANRKKLSYLANNMCYKLLPYSKPMSGTTNIVTAVMLNHFSSLE